MSLLNSLRRAAGVVVFAVPLLAGLCADEIEAPFPAVDAPPVADLPTSTINVAIAMPVASVRSLVEDAVPREQGVAPFNLNLNGGADNCAKGVGIGYGVTRGPISMTARGSTITLSTELSYWARGRARPIGFLGICSPPVEGSCGVGEPPRKAAISLTTTLVVDPSWRLAASTRANPPSPGNRCTVTFLNFDVTDRVIDALDNAMRGAAKHLDGELTRVADLRSRVGHVWSALNDPAEIAPSVWLLTRPTGAGVTPLKGDDKHLRAGVQLVARPVISLGAKPVVSATPLPNMTPAPGGNAFHLAVPIDAAYTTIAHQVDSLFQLKAGGLRYPTSGRYYVKPTALQLYAYGTKVVVRVVFAGSAKGVIYLTGTPSFDPVRNVLTVPDLDYTLETKNMLLKLAHWAESDHFRADLRTRLTLNVDREIASARAPATAALNRKVGPLALTGRVDDLRILGVFAQPDSGRFRMLTTATGTLNVVMP